MIVNRLKVDLGKKYHKGFDGHKRINGRKRHIMVDSLGLILATHVSAANVQDRDMLSVLCHKMKGRFPRMHSVFADSGYEGRQNKTFLKFGWFLKITKRPRKTKGMKGVFKVIQKRWIVERTFSWLGIFRRLSVDFEVSPKSAEAFIHIAAISMSLKKLNE